MIYFVLAIIISYLLGSIPMGLLLTKLMGKGDLRKVGSGNIGATNVMRVGGLRMAGLVWLLDMFKAIVAVFIGYWVGDVAFGAWCGFAVIVGHCYPVWLKFRGGKGISSLGAVIVFCLIPVLGFAIDYSVGWPFLAIGLLCMWRHRANIGRLIGGTESKIEWKWKK